MCRKRGVKWFLRSTVLDICARSSRADHKVPDIRAYRTHYKIRVWMRHIWIHISRTDLSRVVAWATTFCMVYFNIFHITITVLLIYDHFECIAQNSPGNSFTGPSTVGPSYGTSVTLPVLRVLSSSSTHWKFMDSYLYLREDRVVLLRRPAATTASQKEQAVVTHLVQEVVLQYKPTYVGLPLTLLRCV